MELTIELKPHIGKMNTQLGMIDVEHDQWMVFGKSPEIERPVFLGYIGKREGSPFNGYTTYRDLPKAFKDEVLVQVTTLAGWAPKAYEPSTAPTAEQESTESEAEADE